MSRREPGLEEGFGSGLPPPNSITSQGVCDFKKSPMSLSKSPDRIRRMFAEIAPRYDLLNHLLSLNLDRSWRRRAARALRLGRQPKVLDICTGTGDLALEVWRRVGPLGGRVIGADFTREMVQRGEAKRRVRKAEGVSLLIADASALPFASRSFDAVTVAFGLRNVCELDRALEEIWRVLKPGGLAAVLEFSPAGRGWARRSFEAYFQRWLPRIGRWVSGTAAGGEAYAYLPRSVSEFPDAEGFSRVLENAGFTAVSAQRMTLGVAVLHLAQRPLDACAEQDLATAPAGSRGSA